MKTKQLQPQYIQKQFCIYADMHCANSLQDNAAFTINITAKDFALNRRLLRSLNFVSMYAEAVERGTGTEERAISFFCAYLSSFINRTRSIDPDDNLVLMLNGHPQARKVIIDQIKQAANQ